MMKELETVAKKKNKGIEEIVLNLRDYVTPFYFKSGYQNLKEKVMQVGISHFGEKEVD